jgi:hypothetical protein
MLLSQRYFLLGGYSTGTRTVGVFLFGIGQGIGDLHSRSTQFLIQITSENCICRAECTVIAGFWEEARSCERIQCKTSV